MKMHAKEILKNKTDKMVDLIIDEIGVGGVKKITTSFVDKKTDIKYIATLKIQSGDEETLPSQIEDADVSEQILDIISRLGVLEAESDDEILSRLDALEAREDNDTVYDDSGLKARVSLLENKFDEETGVEARLAAIEARLDENNL